MRSGHGGIGCNYKGHDDDMEISKKQVMDRKFLE